ncbi:hypothetical protein OG792_05810 [Micromonospora sp. NBC_01699]|uniref:hypothetical protein n=1 Tax=Micromonospora sp. NBC_01699 TaxID=2975984 RepID=UPI002E31C537|nr:hypothetical protein [Micromonospora sp. NBC_01699]
MTLPARVVTLPASSTHTPDARLADRLHPVAERVALLQQTGVVLQDRLQVDQCRVASLLALARGVAQAPAPLAEDLQFGPVPGGQCLTQVRGQVPLLVVEIALGCPSRGLDLRQAERRWPYRTGMIRANCASTSCRTRSISFTTASLPMARARWSHSGPDRRSPKML